MRKRAVRAVVAACWSWPWDKWRWKMCGTGPTRRTRRERRRAESAGGAARRREPDRLPARAARRRLRHMRYRARRIAWKTHRRRAPLRARVLRRRSGLGLTRATAWGARYGALFPRRRPGVQKRVELPGIVSRARVLAGRPWGAATGFVTGHSVPGQGVLDVDLRARQADGSVVDDLETFTVTRDGRTIDAVDFNFWGVTFARGRDGSTRPSGPREDVSRRGRVRTRRSAFSTRASSALASPEGPGRLQRSASATRGGSASSTWGRCARRRSRDASVDDQAEWLDDGTSCTGSAATSGGFGRRARPTGAVSWPTRSRRAVVATTQVRKHGEHAPVVLGRRREPELREGCS